MGMKFWYSAIQSDSPIKMKMKGLDHTSSVQLLRLQYMEQAPATSNAESQNNLCPWNPEDYSELERRMHVSFHCNCPSRA